MLNNNNKPSDSHINGSNNQPMGATRGEILGRGAAAGAAGGVILGAVSGDSVQALRNLQHKRLQAEPLPIWTMNVMPCGAVFLNGQPLPEIEFDYQKCAAKLGVHGAFRMPAEVMEAEFRAYRRATYSPGSFQFVERVHSLQNELSSQDRFQVTGTITYEGEQIELSSDFVVFADDTVAQVVIEHAARDTKAQLRMLCEGPAVDLDCNVLFQNAAQADDIRQWRVGPNHGRPERLYRLTWRVESLQNVNQLNAYIQTHLTEKTQVAWDNYGVDSSKIVL